MKRLLSVVLLLALGPLLTAATIIDIAQEDRVYNQTGSQCVWCSLETCCRHLKVTKGYNLTRDHKGASGPGEVSAVSRGIGLKVHQRWPGKKDKVSLKTTLGLGVPAAIGITTSRGQHMIAVVGMDETEVFWIENGDKQLRVHRVTMQTFDAWWDGWFIIVIPEGSGLDGTLPFGFKPRWTEVK